MGKALVDYHIKRSNEKNLGLAFSESTEMTTYALVSKGIQGNQRKHDGRLDIVWKEAAEMKGGEDSEKQKREASCLVSLFRFSCFPERRCRG